MITFEVVPLSLYTYLRQLFLKYCLSGDSRYVYMFSLNTSLYGRLEIAVALECINVA